MKRDQTIVIRLIKDEKNLSIGIKKIYRNECGVFIKLILYALLVESVDNQTVFHKILI